MLEEARYESSASGKELRRSWETGQSGGGREGGGTTVDTMRLIDGLMEAQSRYLAGV